MKAVIMAENSDESMLTSRALSWIASSLENLQAGEMIVTGRSALEDPLRSWYEKERGRFSMPVTFRFYNGDGHSREGDPMIRLLGREALRDCVLLISPSAGIPADLILQRCFSYEPR